MASAKPMSVAPRLRIVAARGYERAVAFRFPFRFGVAEVSRTAQAFISVEIETIEGHHATGWAAEMMMPKWFDKNPDLTPDDTIDQLRRSLHIAMELAANAEPDTPFGLSASIEPEQHRLCAAENIGGLAASFGLALVDRAVIDALGKLMDRPTSALVQSNALGIDARTAPDLSGFDLDGFFASLTVAPTIAVRHTVGLGDALCANSVANRLNDGLPESLEEVIAAYGHTWFKLKLAGDPQADCARMLAIAAVLDRMVPEYKLTLDGNEQYANELHVLELLELLKAEPRLKRFMSRVIFIEQPIARAQALSAPVNQLARALPVEIDESDADISAFATAKRLGYTGISSKSCKGFYRALLNAARVAKWNAETDGAPFFMSAEDLTTQAGLGIQQDLILASLIGATHIERNGHHFVDGMAGAPDSEQSAYLAAHGDLYEERLGRARLKIEKGFVSLGTIADAKGLGASVLPDTGAMTPLQ